MTSTAPTLTLRDIADLARVRRPVVSMWRKRPRARGKLIPFPEPVEVAAGIERFGRDAIVDWLERTGRGNNGEARLDAPALSAPAGASLEGLVTLLCLKASTGEELAGTSPEQRLALARSADPRDEFMLREVREVRAAPDALRFIDDLVEASYGTGEALERLHRGRVSRTIGARDLTTDAVDLVRTVATACALHLDSEDVALSPAGASLPLSLALVGDFARLVVPGDSADQRALRRRAAICGIEAAVEAPGPRVRILSVVGAGPDTALDAVDDVVIELGADDTAVVLGPAAVLCDGLVGGQDQKRAQTLRSGNLRIALRLPRGMWRAAHRQALGIWVCAGDGSTSRPFVTDLAAFTEHELEATDLAADVMGALTVEMARSFRYGRPHDLQTILSTRVVVPRGTRAIRLVTTDAASHLDRVHAATLITAEPLPSFDILATAASGSVVLRRRSLGELVGVRQAQVKRGNRIDTDHADPDGSVAVLSATGEMGITLDPFDAAKFYPRATRTEPGDVVFTEKPRPKARVDRHGGSLVASPSKALRLSPSAGLGPHTVAAIINELPETANEWQTWDVPVLDTAEADQLEAALVAAISYETSVRRRLDALRDMTRALIDGVAAGSVTIKPAITAER